MKIRFSFTLILTFLISLQLYSQSIKHIKGKIRSAKDSSAVAFAVIAVNKTNSSCQSGLDGVFDLQLYATVDLLTDTINIHCLGFEKHSILLGQVAEKELNIFLMPADYIKDEVPVLAYSIKRILRMAIENIPVNYPSCAYTMNALYTQYHKENGRYVRLIESDIDIYHEPYTSVTSASQKEMIMLKHVRRSYNYEENKEEHGDHLMDLLSENPVRYVIGTVLNIKAFDSYRFHIEQTTVDSSTGKKYYHFSFISKPGFEEKKERGEIIIVDSSFAITYIKIIQERNPNGEQKGRISAGRYDWKFVNGVLEARFEEQQNGKYYPCKLFKSYLHELADNVFHDTQYHVEETFHLVYDLSSYAEVKDVSLRRNFHRMSNLYYHKYQYDKIFWDNYKIIDKSFPAGDINKDLSFKKSLNEQYVEAGK